jgi:hypothetical protein
LGCYHEVVKADLRISVKDYHHNKNFKIPYIAIPLRFIQFQIDTINMLLLLNIIVFSAF